MASFTVNGKPVSVDADPKTPLLWVIRDVIGLTGTKYGCGAGFCGSCTVHIDGRAQHSCQVQISAAEGANIVTIEGLSPDSSHPLQKDAPIPRAVRSAGRVIPVPLLGGLHHQYVRV